jgi:hypothetical protein
MNNNGFKRMEWLGIPIVMNSAGEGVELDLTKENITTMQDLESIVDRAISGTDLQPDRLVVNRTQYKDLLHMSGDSHQKPNFNKGDLVAHEGVIYEIFEEPMFYNFVSAINLDTKKLEDVPVAKAKKVPKGDLDTLKTLYGG